MSKNGPQNKNIKKTIVSTDIEDFLQNGDFSKSLNGANPKLLSQLKNVLKNPMLTNGGIVNKKMNNKLVRYELPLPVVSEEWIDAAISSIDTEYRNNRMKANKKLGKIFVSEYMKNIPVLHSGKIDAGKTTSGKYLPVGTKVKLDIGKNSIIRCGASWKSREENPISICIDPSITIMNGNYAGRVINWQNPTLENVANSSGDITMANTNIWSTELIDIDANKMLEKKSTKFYTTLINYDSPRGSLTDVQCHVFFNIIDKEDRIIDGRLIEIPLDKMQHSYEITDAIPAEIGLLFDLENEVCEVLKIPVEKIYNAATANSLRGELDSLVYCKSEPSFVFNEIHSCLEESQIVKNKEEADLVIDASTDHSLIQSILF